MRPALLSRIAALEAVAPSTDGVGVILLSIINPDPTAAPVARYSGDGLEWTLKPNESAEDFERALSQKRKPRQGRGAK